MERSKKRLLFVVVILLIGLWFGYNLGKGRPFWSNPFQSSEQAKLKSKAQGIVKDTKRALRESLSEEQ